MTAQSTGFFWVSLIRLSRQTDEAKPFVVLSVFLYLERRLSQHDIGVGILRKALRSAIESMVAATLELRVRADTPTSDRDELHSRGKVDRKNDRSFHFWKTLTAVSTPPQRLMGKHSSLGEHGRQPDGRKGHHFTSHVTKTVWSIPLFALNN